MLSSIFDLSNYSLITSDCNKIKCLLESIYPIVLLYADENLALQTKAILDIYDLYQLKIDVRKLSNLRSEINSRHLEFFDKIYSKLPSYKNNKYKFYDEIEIENYNTGLKSPAPEKFYLAPFAYFAKDGLSIMIDEVFSKEISFKDKIKDAGADFVELGKVAKILYRGKYNETLKSCFCKEIDISFSNKRYFESEDKPGLNSAIIPESKNIEEEAVKEISLKGIDKDYSKGAQISSNSSLDLIKRFIEKDFGGAITIKRTGELDYKGLSTERDDLITEIGRNIPATTTIIKDSETFYSKACVLEGLKNLAELNIVPVEFVELQYRVAGVDVPGSSLETRISQESAQTECFNKINNFISKYSDVNKKTHPYNFYMPRLREKSSADYIGGEQNRIVSIQLLEKILEMHKSLNQAQKNYFSYNAKFSNDPIVNFYGQTFINKESTITSKKKSLVDFLTSVVVPFNFFMNQSMEINDARFWADKNLHRLVRDGGEHWNYKDVIYLDMTNDADLSRIKIDENNKKYVDEAGEKFLLDDREDSKNGKYVFINYLSDIENLVDSISSLDCYSKGECSFDTEEAGIFNTICAHVNSEKVFTKKDDGSVILDQASEEKFKNLINDILIGFYTSQISMMKNNIIMNEQSVEKLFDTLYKHSPKEDSFYERANYGVKNNIESKLKKIVEESMTIEVQDRRGRIHKIDLRVADPEMAEAIEKSIMGQNMPGYKKVPSKVEINELNKLREDYEEVSKDGFMSPAESEFFRENGKGDSAKKEDYVEDYLNHLISYLINQNI